MAIAAENATGWSELMDANVVGAAYNMFNHSSYFNGWVIAILFILFQTLLLMKTRNPMLSWLVGAVMLALIWEFVKPTVLWTIFGILVFEFVAVLYTIFWK